MPANLERCVAELVAKGHEKASAYAICTAAIAKRADADADEIVARVLADASTSGPQNVAGHIEIAKIDREQGIVYGWAYTSRDDNGEPPEDGDGRVVGSTEELEKGAHRFMIESRRGDILHQADAPAQLVASLVVTDEIAKVLGIPGKRRGWLTGWKFDTASPAWQAVKSGALPELSWKGRASGRPWAEAA